MKLAQLTVSTAVLLLSTTTAFAQQGTTTNQNVFIDVGGTPIQVPIATATEACSLDEAGVQQAALSRVESSGLDDAAVQELMATAAPAGTMAVTGGTDTAAADPTSTPAPGSEPASTATVDGAGASTPAPGGGSASTDMAASGNAATSNMTDVLESADTTAAETTATPDGSTTAAQGLDSEANQQMLALAVCQIELTRAAELGITDVGNGATTDAGTTAGSGG
jgi:hypothetical protein